MSRPSRVTQDDTKPGIKCFRRYVEFQIMSRPVSLFMSRLKDQFMLCESQSQDFIEPYFSGLSLELTHESTQALVSRLKVQLKPMSRSNRRRIET